MMDPFNTGMIASFMAYFAGIFLFIFLAYYIYFSLAWMTIANKLKYKHSWIAWIPGARTAMILKLGNLPWPLVFLYFIPVLGWIALGILRIIASWHIFEKRKYPGWFALAGLFVFIPKVGLLLPAIVVGFVAWGDRKKMLTF